MRKIKLGLAAALLSTAAALPAKADVTVVADVLKIKNVTVSQSIDIRKIVRIEANMDIQLDAAAESLAIANMLVNNNRVDRANDVTAAISGKIRRRAEMGLSVGGGGGQNSGNIGIIGVNQDVGNFSNQGNLVSFAFTDDDDAFVDAEASADQRVNNNTVDWATPPTARLFEADLTIDVRTMISQSISNNIGIVGVNQNAGNGNNQLNALSAAVGLQGDGPEDERDHAFAMAEADLGQWSSGNTVSERSVHRDAKIRAGSISNNHGVVGVNQSSGNLALQANVVAVGAAIVD